MKSILIGIICLVSICIAGCTLKGFESTVKIDETSVDSEVKIEEAVSE